MTYLFNQPSAFAAELIEGFVAANADKVRQVPGGVVRNTRSQPGSVAVVVGGGSGHYPAFAGLVGQGLAHGAAMGNLFASPSAQQIYNVARAANNGGGVLLMFGNYAGDVLHFGQACERLRGEGIPCDILAVTDDISSAGIDEIEKRRGVAGDLTVFKVACAAAEAGYTLAEVLRVAQHANNRTRSFGVAFSGCTLPGASHPLFEVEKGRMALGLGIHGEPGIKETEVPTADEMADIFVSRLLSELPPGVSQTAGQRVAVILNGLGTVKYEELFVVYRRVAQLLEAARLQIVEPDVGEFVTSFNMAGASLTLMWLDDELETFWRAPANAPAYRKGSVIVAEPLGQEATQVQAEESLPVASAASQQSAQQMLQLLEAVATMLQRNAEKLGDIDAVAGDGDHGIGMERGVLGAVEKARQVAARGAGAGTLLCRAADAWADKAGGTSGALWGVALTAIGTAIGDNQTPDAARIARGVRQAQEGIQHFGKARVGDKTMVDVLVPFSDSLNAAVARGASLTDAWHEAARVADQAAQATAQLLPKMGRARPLAEKSLGTPDAGAISLAMIVNTVADLLKDHATAGQGV
ncbi:MULTISPECIES: dihydroxyacetone kinase family protein [Pantoea]|jgi:dihydroxyacetone kinase|uniref:Dihydroxyacetone kinase family protein n=1 Tax=Pantoea brenneri TaxID=472694 RepID=A0A7Y6TST4_9GAMM|nr:MULTISPECIES: dihydroxyacetone kinase family protein [Pantoea]MBZ6396208.1 dihydroxyacetone kinase family protein [Pantoea sp.]MBZ6439614.1 dihydroxyacetone kinase family protein [Pantoea sp.]NUY42429.1 dihydroxyacetone kinase family protein [Pantoea brenneri]NUY50054.1 dihydroxyacetone kinase family protein [Pantoea brenneri]NUY60339.1 dihydroxyacetone kinase family protein [Pantoea brenneri]